VREEDHCPDLDQADGEACNMVEAAGVGIFWGAENTQVIDF
jgi:hypothetical protein